MTKPTKTRAGHRKNTVSKNAAKRPAAQRKTAQHPAPPTTAEQPTKKEAVLALLRRENGATLAELMTATGWQAHSVRGFISGTLRKRLGLVVQRASRKDAMLAYYLIVAAC